MNQVFEKIYEDYKRANKSAREKTWKKYGFNNEIDFLKFLGSSSDPASNPPPRDKVIAGRKKPAKVAIASVEAPTDMVIAFDTTGSMNSYIAAVRKHVEETINNVFENVPNLRLKLVAFGDYCDMPRNEKGFGKAYQETALTADKNALVKFVQDAQNTGGGDGPEFYELVLNKIILETPWRSTSNRSILLIGDDYPHEVGYTLKPWITNARIDWKVEAKRASDYGIKIDTLRIHPGVKWYEELSRITNGTCMNFKSAEKTHNIFEAATYLNSKSSKGIAATKILYRTAMADGDLELMGAYKGMASDRGINLDE